MKKKYFISYFALFSSICLLAQPQLNSTDFPAVYSSSIYSADISSLTSVGNAGPNQSWDFSEVPLTLDGTISVIPANTTPYFADFPSANYCWKSTSNGNTFTEYEYHTLTSDNFTTIGSASAGGVSILSNPNTIFTFPFVFNTTVNDVFQYQSGSPITYNSTYDAYGTLITPFGTFTNVIRKKTIESNSAYTYYVWFTTNPRAVLMDGAISANDAYLYVYDNTPLATLDLQKQNLVDIYPNPAKNVLNLLVDNSITIEKITILDFTGKIIKTSEAIEQIDISNLSSGLYFIQANYEDKVITNKFVKE
jgi:hypothetical protein